MGSMTALLVLVSQTVSINSYLPKTTYFKVNKKSTKLKHNNFLQMQIFKL